MSFMASRQQVGASCSNPAFGQQVRAPFRKLQRRRQLNRTHDLVPCASSGSTGSAESFARDVRTAASRAFNQAKVKWDAFAKEQRLEQRANDALSQASASAREVADKAKDKARRVFVQLDSEYELTSKTARAARRAEEVARDIDQAYGVRRRVRSATDYVVRSWPTWQRQLDEFAATWYGKATVFVALCLLVSSPIFWAVLNVLLLLWWLSVPAAMLLLNRAREQQAQRLQQQQQEAEAEARRAANPFADLFGAARWGRGADRRTGSSRGRYARQDGPVIEAEWTTIDEGNEPGGSSSGNRKRR